MLSLRTTIVRNTTKMMRDCCVYLLATGLLLSVPAALNAAGIFDGLKINTPLAKEIIRQAKSAGMISYMNSRVNPCDDFYGYACGNFVRSNPATERTSSSDLYSSLYAGYQRRVIQLLKQPKMTTDSATATQVKYFYESCLNTASLEMKQRPHLLSILKELGGMPALEGNAWDESKFDAIEMMAQLLKRFGKETMLGVQVAGGLANSKMNRLYLGQLDSIPGPEDYTRQNSIRNKIRRNLEQLLGLNETVAYETSFEISKLYYELADGVIVRREQLSPAQTNRLRLLQDMSESYGPTLNLTRFVNLWLGHDYQLPVYEYVDSYLWNLKKLLAKTPKRILANFLLSTLLSDFDIVPAETTVKQEELCADKTTELFTDIVDYMAYRSLEKQNPDIPGNFRQMWQELKVSFGNMLRSPSNNWLDEKTLNAALAKLKAMSFHILGDDAQNLENYYKSLIIGTDDYFGNVQRVLELRGYQLRESLQRPVDYSTYNGISMSPFYVTDANRVVLPTSCMQHRYFYDDVYPMALKYATLGFILGHEMAHGFDDSTRTFDDQGNLRDWWERNATEQFEQRKQCLSKQFSDVQFKGKKLSPSKLQSENIADNVGVRIAHAAYNNWLENSVLDSEVLPKMTHTPQQLFFLALGQMWCSDLLPELRGLSQDVHDPNEVRLHAIMGNFEAFAKAYECSKNATMAYTKSCVIF